MDQEHFAKNLREAVEHAVRFARDHVIQVLPDAIALRVYANCSYDGNPLVGDEVVFPNDTQPQGIFRGPWTVDEAVIFLWRDGRVPEWIDVAVEDEDGKTSYAGLRCCGRFTAVEENLYHRNGGIPPFHILSPPIEPSAWDRDTNKMTRKYDLHWQRKRGLK